MWNVKREIEWVAGRWEWKKEKSEKGVENREEGGGFVFASNYGERKIWRYNGFCYVTALSHCSWWCLSSAVNGLFSTALSFNESTSSSPLVLTIISGNSLSLSICIFTVIRNLSVSLSCCSVAYAGIRFRRFVAAVCGRKGTDALHSVEYYCCDRPNPTLQVRNYVVKFQLFNLSALHFVFVTWIL